MGTTRYFSGSRDVSKRGVAYELLRLEMQKKGKLPQAERYKRLFKQKMDESQKKLNSSRPGSRTMSKRAEEALKQIAAKKAAKQAKADRMMVIVQPRTYANGRISQKGVIQDIAGNTVARVNLKKGTMVTSGGWSIGRYKPKNYMTDLAIQGAIDKFSPYYINLRKMQAMQGGLAGNGVWGPEAGHDVINVYGRSAGGGSSDQGSLAGLYGYGESGSMFSGYGSDVAAPRQNVGATAWGAMSDNTWGTFSDNVWGASLDNVWGGNSSDVWGGIGGNPWGNHAKTVRIWGTGSGNNYLKSAINHIAALFGLNVKSNKNRLAAMHEASRSLRSSGGSGSRSATRAADHGPTRSAPTTTRSGGH